MIASLTHLIHIIIVQITQHDYHMILVFPYHPPEIIHCVLQRALCSNEIPSVLIPLQHTQ